MIEFSSASKAEVAAAITRIERAPDDKKVAELLDRAWVVQRGLALGLTGPPGVGKSTLTQTLVEAWASQGLKVAVLAIDPSSKRSGGALLGDRTRMQFTQWGDQVFTRSMAAGDRLGGLAESVFPVTVLLRAIFDRVLIETVGVGQSETEIANVADTVALCVQPGSGDSLQFMKSGIAEVPDIVFVTKADLGAPAQRALADMRGALSLNVTGQAKTPVLLLSAKSGLGVGEAIAQIEICLKDTGGARRQSQLQHHYAKSVQDAFGKAGLVVGAQTLSHQHEQPFQAFADFLSRFRVQLEPPL